MHDPLPRAAHIAIYLPSLRGGGAERVMAMLANGLARRGHRVDLVLVRAEGPFLAELDAQVRVIDLECRRVIHSLPALVGYLRRDRPEAMLSALNHANIVAIAARGLARHPPRLVVSERNSLTSLGTGAKGRLFRALMRGFYPAADHVTTVTEAGRQEMIAAFALPAVTPIPNPVPLSDIRALAARRPDHPWAQPGATPFLLAVGRLEPQKDHATLLRAFALLRASRNIRLVILGEGSLRPVLERQIRDLGLEGAVALPGFQVNPYGWMAACAAYVLSSRFEGFPNSLIQALACGARVVSTDCPTGPREILDHGRWGHLVPVGDAPALCAAMRAALSAPGGAERSAYLARFRPERIVRAYEEVLL